MAHTDYVTLTITDKQNGNKKTYQVERGSILIHGNEKRGKITKSIHTIDKDTTIDLTLPQYQAMQAFDHDKNGKLDTKDQEFFINRHQKYLDSLPEEAFDGLYLEDRELYENISGRLGDSKFHICENGGGAILGVYETGFQVLFEDKYWFEDGEREIKGICFQTPAQAQYCEDLERAEKERKELEKLENERKDLAYAKKHWIRNLFGISRKEYEKNHEADY